MQLQIAQCDLCRYQAEIKEKAEPPEVEPRPSAGALIVMGHQAEATSSLPEGWARFTTSFSDGTVSTVELDVCQTCAVMLKESLTKLLGAQVPDNLESIETVEQRHILAVLTATDWNKSKASEVLGIQRSTLDRKLKKYRAVRPVGSNG